MKKFKSFRERMTLQLMSWHMLSSRKDQSTMTAIGKLRKKHMIPVSNDTDISWSASPKLIVSNSTRSTGNHLPAFRRSSMRSRYCAKWPLSAQLSIDITLRFTPHMFLLLFHAAPISDHSPFSPFVYNPPPLATYISPPFSSLSCKQIRIYIFRYVI